ncbi:MAG TPA: uroporphyrinogen-III C-methyltransferase [Thermoanaerobaculia bacterium]|nr:uroporphyrinogen-III C-methyltransferase [Thermoanaerobaculia bacterium]
MTKDGATGRSHGAATDHGLGKAAAPGRRPGAATDHGLGKATAPGRGIVYLVGAGPGDPELITVRGLRCLRQADVVVYDRLIDARLLAEAPPAARRVYAGKAPGRQALRQEEIQALLVRQARAGRVVVRLKGGDPFVFGRGGEEALACAAAGVAWEAVPGVTSAVAVPALAGIPLTQRGVAASFAVVTGHSAGDAGLDWSALARIETLVVLMGAARLGEIATLLASHGKAPETPVAVIENGSRESERVLIGTLGDIAAVAAAAALSSPATIVVGEVVRLRPALAPAAASVADTPAGRRFA